jgi:type III pantothenate kinase
MMPMLVADIGNTRIKWGLCGAEGIERAASLPDNSDAWRNQLSEWRLSEPQRWTLAGVHPRRRDQFAVWLREAGHNVRVLDHFSQLPLELSVGAPERVGIDRLLNVLAAKALATGNARAIVVDVGSAITVDLLDEGGSFAGGSIFPGLRLMAEALHDYTAMLPLVKVTEHPTALPGKSTGPAIAAGIYWAAAGGIAALIRELHRAVPGVEPLPVFLTGGDAAVIAGEMPDQDLYRYELRPMLTLEGIRIAAAHAP